MEHGEWIKERYFASLRLCGETKGKLEDRKRQTSICHSRLSKE